MAKVSQGMKTGDISDARDSEDEEVEERRYSSILAAGNERIHGWSTGQINPPPPQII